MGNDIETTSGTLCGLPIRAGIDKDILALLAAVESFFYQMRDLSVKFTVANDRDRAAAQQWLLYLSILIDIGLSSASAVALHNLPYTMLMLRRLVLEYVIKAMYYDKHPKRAHYELTVGMRRDALKRLRDTTAPAQEIADAEAELEEALRQFPDHSTEKRLTFADMMRDITDPETHAALYRGPSTYIHADALGMSELMPTVNQRTQGNIDISNERLNANLVDLGSDVLVFCGVFLDNFPKSNTPDMVKELDQLRMQCAKMALRHSYGRGSAALEELEALFAS